MRGWRWLAVLVLVFGLGSGVLAQTTTTTSTTTTTLSPQPTSNGYVTALTTSAILAGTRGAQLAWVDTTLGAVTVTLPTAVSNAEVTVVHATAEGNTMTVQVADTGSESVIKSGVGTTATTVTCSAACVLRFTSDTHGHWVEF